MDEDTYVYRTPIRSPLNLRVISDMMAVFHHVALFERIRKRYRNKKKQYECNFTPWKQVIGFDVIRNE